MHRLIATTLLALVALAGCDFVSTSAEPKTSAAAAEEVKVQYLDYDGIQSLIAGHKGKKLVVVDYWSTSCAPCIKELPGLVALHKKHGDKVACITISSDFIGIGKPEDVAKDKILPKLKELGVTCTNVVTHSDADAILKRLKISAVPVVRVYDLEGNLAQEFNDDKPFTYKEVTEKVEALLKK